MNNKRQAAMRKKLDYQEFVLLTQQLQTMLARWQVESMRDAKQ